jgi:DNA modification methylase
MSTLTTPTFQILQGDCRALLTTLPDSSMACCVTSPPYYGLRSYLPADHPDKAAELGLEPTLDQYIQNLVAVFREVRRVLRPDGSLWLNLGDAYAGSWGNYGARTGHQRPRWSECWERPAYETGNGYRDRPPTANVPGLVAKNLLGIPWQVAFALQADGWILRSDIIWEKPNCQPESVRDRPTRSHEYLFLLTPDPRYYYDREAIRESFQTDPKERYPQRARVTGRGQQRAARAAVGTPQQDKSGGYPAAACGRNKRSVWSVATRPGGGSGLHFATFPPDLVRPCILAGTSEYGVCPHCHAPYRRQLQPTREYGQLLGRDWSDPERDQAEGRGHFQRPDGSHAAQRPVKRNAPSVTASYSTVGWQKSCACGEAAPVPATVLDPFAGVGTTLQVAVERGRSAVGIELCGQYADLARQRLSLLN